MAKYDVTFSCGHTETRQLVGPNKVRERKIEWWQSHGVCDACFRQMRADEREAANARAAGSAAALGLPELVGTPKQIAWAETIRVGLVADLQKRLANATEEQAASEQYQRTEQFAAWLCDQSEARWWIDRRDVGLRDLLVYWGKTHCPEALPESVKARPTQTEAIDAAAQATIAAAEKQKRLWALKDETAAKLRTFFPGRAFPLQVGTWSGAKRVYAGGYGNNFLTYHHTGDSRHRPGTIELAGGYLAEGKTKEELRDLLAWVCAEWNEVKIGVSA